MKLAVKLILAMLAVATQSMAATYLINDRFYDCEMVELNSRGDTVEFTPFEGSSITFEYDELHRRVKRGKCALIYTDDGFVKEERCPLNYGGITKYAYDGFGRLSTETWRNGVTIYKYDDDGKLIYQKDSVGSMKLLGRLEMGNYISHRYFTYRNTRLVSVRTETQYPGANTVTKVSKERYNKQGIMIYKDNGSIEYVYDNHGNEIKKKFLDDGFVYHTKYKYDSKGRIVFKLSEFRRKTERFVYFDKGNRHYTCND